MLHSRYVRQGLSLTWVMLGQMNTTFPVPSQPCQSYPSPHPHPHQSPPLPLSSLYKPSSLKQISQSSADSSLEPGILGEGGHLCSHPLLITKWEEVLPNRGNPFIGHLPSLGSEPFPERRVGRTGRGYGRCSRGYAWGKGNPLC